MASRVEIRELKKRKARRKAMLFFLIILFITVFTISYKKTIQQIEELESLNTKIDTGQLIRDMIEKNKQKEEMENQTYGINNR